MKKHCSLFIIITIKKEQINKKPYAFVKNVYCSNVVCASFLKQDHKHKQLIYYVAPVGLLAEKKNKLELLVFLHRLMLLKTGLCIEWVPVNSCCYFSPCFRFHESYPAAWCNSVNWFCKMKMEFPASYNLMGLSE